MSTMRVFFFSILVITGLSVKAVDFKMSAFTWTFNDYDTNVLPSGIYNFDGLYFQGGAEASVIDLNNGELKGNFSDGSEWSAKKAFFLRGIFDSSNLDGERCIAGFSNNNGLQKCLAFNVSVPGTCYVIFKSVQVTRNEVSLHSQYKSFDVIWKHLTTSSILGEEITELKLETTQPGSFWISSNTDGVYVLAVRFVPDSGDIFALQKSRQLPVEIKKVSNEKWFADFGKDAFGQVEITLTSNTPNDTVYLYLGECLTNGYLEPKPGGSRRYEKIVIPLEVGTHVYKPIIPHKTYSNGLASIYMPMEIGEVMPFRYCEVERYNGVLNDDDIVRLSVNYQFDDASSSFHSDNEVLNKIWELCKYSIKATSFMGYYVDGDRERRPYEADALINQLGHYATDVEFQPARRTIDWLLHNPTWPTEWIMQTVLMAYYDYLYSGDNTLISKYADKLYHHTLMAFVNSETGLVTTKDIEQTQVMLAGINRGSEIRDIVDWPHSDDPDATDGGEDDGFVYTDYNAVVNAYHFYACTLMAKIYKAIGIPDKQKELEAYSNRFKHLFNETFLDKERGIYKDGIGTKHSSLHSNMFALCFGLVPTEYVNSVLGFIQSRGMVCSVYGSQFLLDALYEGRAADTAFKLLTSESDRSWMNMLKEGSTITTEAWGNRFKLNQDWNHAWGAAPANIIPFRLVGIRPLAPGFEIMEIRPQIADLHYVECKTPTCLGPVSVKIQITDVQYSMDIEIPMKSKCVVYIPNPLCKEYELYVDEKKTEVISRDNSFLKVSESLSGRHNIRLVYKTPVSIRTKTCDYPESHELYNLNGLKITNPEVPGLYISKEGKFLIK